MLKRLNDAETLAMNNAAKPTSLSRLHPPRVRVLVIPGLHNSGVGHWQSWLETQYHDPARVTQIDWSQADLEAWSARIGETLHQHASQNVRWVAVAHSFGCLALAHHLAHQPAHAAAPHSSSDQHSDDDDRAVGGRIVSALMVAPADPLKFGVTDRLPHHGLGLPLHLIGSENDPWMPLERARAWAMQWRGVFQNLGAAGHINIESGFGPWPLARQKVDHMVRLQEKEWRLSRSQQRVDLPQAA
jgi:predicted alpha/beta hydrolase family esterase